MKKRARPCEIDITGRMYLKKQRINYSRLDTDKNEIELENVKLKQELMNVKNKLSTSLSELAHIKSEIVWMKKEIHARLEGNYKIELSKQLTDMRRNYESELCKQERHYHTIIAGMVEKDVPMSIYG